MHRNLMKVKRKNIYVVIKEKDNYRIRKTIKKYTLKNYDFNILRSYQLKFKRENNIKSLMDIKINSLKNI